MMPTAGIVSAFASVLLAGTSFGAEIHGSVADRTGARIPRATAAARQLDGAGEHQTTSREDGNFVLPNLPRLTLTAVLDTASVRSEVNVSASADQVQVNSPMQSKTLTAHAMVSVPTASRNVSHLIVADAGVSAPLPDRTGKGMNLATSPGSQSEDATQTLNPSVNGARTSNNALQLNGLDVTNMMNAAGGLASNMTIPLDALQEVEVQTALYGANTGRNGGGNIQLTLRGGANAYHGGAYHYLQNERFNANEFFLNQAGTARPMFRRNESGLNVGGPIFRNKTFFFASVQRTDFLSGYATSAIARSSFPTGLTDIRTRESIAEVANRWLESGSRVTGFAQNFMNALKAFPADQQPGLIAKFFADPATLQFRRLTANDIHPVAINVLNQKRDGKFLIPSVQPTFQQVAATASFGEEYRQTLVMPTFFNSWSGLGTIEHHFSASHRTKLSYVRSAQQIQEAFGWADASPSPTLGQTPGWTAQLTDTRLFGPKWINELRGGFFELYNTRISQFRDITNSSLGIYNPLEQAIGGLASLMPTIDISTSGGNSGGIGNAWDFFDRQRVINVVDTLSYNSGRHTLQFGAEGRVHGAHQRRSGLRQLGAVLHRARRGRRRLRPGSGRYAAALQNA